MRHFKRPLHTQTGISLLVGLVMLAVLTLLVVSAVRMSNSNLKIVGNQQARDEITAAAQQAIEQVMSSASNFYTPVAQTFNIDANNDGTPDYTVQTTAPICLQTVPVEGYSEEFATSAPQDTHWDIAATATDPRTGATITIHQGVKVRMDSSAICPG